MRRRRDEDHERLRPERSPEYWNAVPPTHRARLMAEYQDPAASAVSGVVPNPATIAQNVPGSAWQAVTGVVDFFGLGGAESRARSAAMRQGLGETLSGLPGELWQSAMDPNAGLFDHFQQPDAYPILSGMASGTPFGPGGWGGFVQHVEQNPAEWLFDLGLSATGFGAAARLRRGVPSFTPMQQFARGWTEVDPSTVPNYPGRWVGGDAPALGADLEARVIGRQKSGLTVDPEFEDAYVGPEVIDRQALLDAFETHRRAEYRVRYMGDEAFYRRNPETGQSEILGFRPESEIVASRLERADQLRSHLGGGGEETLGIFGRFERFMDRQADPIIESDIPHSLGDYHSGEIQQSKYLLGAREMAIGGGISLGVGSAVYGWQRYFGGDSGSAIPHFTASEREQALREIQEGGDATEGQIAALSKMYPDKDLSNLTKVGASELFDSYERPQRAERMATDAQVAALSKMYPDRDLSGLTMSGASDLFSSYERPQRFARSARSDAATEGQLNFLNQLRSDGDRSGGVMPIEQVNEGDGTSKAEAAALIDYELAVKKSERIAREAQQGRQEDEGPAMASQGQLDYLIRLNPDRYGSLGEGIAVERGPGRSRRETDPMGIEDVDISDGLTKREASTLFDYEAAVKKSERIRREAAGPEMASKAQIAALRRRFPHMFEDDAEEESRIPFDEIEFGETMTAEQAREAFKYVPESPPPMATKRQVARLEAEFPHAFKNLGDADEYLASGQSYGIVRSLEDIYDADTFTGMLYNAETGQTLKEDTVRLGDFNAPEIRPDQFKPKEFQEREAARAREARDVFRSMVGRYNVGRDVENEGYVIPIEYRQDSAMPGGLERGMYGRVLGDVNFEGVDYEQFMIQQGMGSVYGAQVEWGAEEIDPASLWRRAPTYTEQLGDMASKALWNVPGNIVGGVLEGRGIGGSVEDTLRGTASGLRDAAISRAKQTAVRATTDWFKESFTDDFTPNELGFVQRYVGDLGGIGEKAGSFLKSGAGSALGALALAAGTFYIGEKSLDEGYEEVIASKDDREGQFYEQFRKVDRGRSGGGMQKSDGLLLAQIEKVFRKVLKESGERSFSKTVTRIGRQSKINIGRGL